MPSILIEVKRKYTVEQEIEILGALNHPNIVKLYGYGSNGQIVKPSGK